MGYTLLIAEKPAAAKKIAEALADKKCVKKSEQGVPYFLISHEGKELVVASAVGHLFGLKSQSPGFTFPVFDVEWEPIFKINKDSAFSKKYHDLLKKLSKDAQDFYICTDFDVEGETIGLNIIRYICKQKDAHRMKFSTLTKPDLIKAFNAAQPTLDWGQAKAGETRHFLDYYYGINLSRALTIAIKKSGMFKILSTGRVQGPALKIIVDREKEIKAFVPVPYWDVEMVSDTINAFHEKNPIFEKNVAEGVMKKVTGIKKATVVCVDAKQFKQSPPNPFDLTTLQTEAFRCFGINPKKTLEIGQELYTGGFISYPRTSSQQLPEAIGFADIIKQLAKAFDVAKKLLNKTLKPNNGEKTDPAHPAIYPTGIIPEGLDAYQSKVYELIVKRFLATFGEPATRETVNIRFDANTEFFIAKGTRTVFQGWHELYAPFLKLEEVELPHLKQNDIINVKEFVKHDEQTKPPKRYTQSSIIKELERRSLGTKATRAEIVDTLYQRQYVKGETVEATDLGIHIIEVLEKYCEKIVDEALTRHFEDDMDSIREGKQKMDGVLLEARKVLGEILDDFKKKEKEIGEGLLKTFAETKAAMITVGKCPKCEGSLIMRKGKFGRFIACDKYPDCKTTFKLPLAGKIEVLKGECEHCKHPLIKIIRKAKRPQEVCINPDCPSKKVPEVAEKICPKCKQGKMVVRKSVYGAFLACNKYPECRYTESFEQ